MACVYCRACVHVRAQDTTDLNRAIKSYNQAVRLGRALVCRGPPCLLVDRSNGCHKGQCMLARTMCMQPFSGEVRGKLQPCRSPRNLHHSCTVTWRATRTPWRTIPKLPPSTHRWKQIHVRERVGRVVVVALSLKASVVYASTTPCCDANTGLVIR